MEKGKTIVNHSEELLSYIKGLTHEQAKEALVIASAWLLERQEALQHLQQKEF